MDRYNQIITIMTDIVGETVHPDTPHLTIKHECRKALDKAITAVRAEIDKPHLTRVICQNTLTRALGIN